MHAYSHVSARKMQYCVPLTPVVGAYSKLCKAIQYWYPMAIEMAHILYSHRSELEYWLGGVELQGYRQPLGHLAQD